MVEIENLDLRFSDSESNVNKGDTDRTEQYVRDQVALQDQKQTPIQLPPQWKVDKNPEKSSENH